MFCEFVYFIFVSEYGVEEELIVINNFLSNPYGAPFNVNSNTCVLFPLCYYSNIEQKAVSFFMFLLLLLYSTK